MKKEDLEAGTKLQSRIVYVESTIKKLENDKKTTHIGICIVDHGGTIVKKRDTYTEKANTNLAHLNQVYRESVLKILKDCKDKLEKEFELLGK